MVHDSGGSPEQNPTFPHVILDDIIGKPLDISLDGNP
jgi:hypothetical protein